MRKEKKPFKVKFKAFFKQLEQKKVPLFIGAVVLISFAFYQNLTCGRAEYSFSNIPNDTASSSSSGGASGAGFLSANLAQREETFAVTATTPVKVEIPAPVDLLFVMDNSASMGDDQQKLSDSFRRFADTYFSSTRDIRIARITTDAYKAGSRDSDCSKSTWCDVNNSLLVMGWADGSNPPQPSQVRSGRPILSTLLPPTYAGTSTQWLDQLKTDFDINIKVGTLGNHTEKSMQSLYKFFLDNESRDSCSQVPITDPQCFFRKNTARVIVFISDEKDSSNFDGSPDSNPSADAAIDYNVGFIKGYVNSFFRRLDVNSVNPNYMVVAVTSNSANKNKAYLRLVDSVKTDAPNALGSLSFSSSITNPDFDDLLSNIGQTIQETINVTTVYSNFTLAEIPSSFNDVAVYGIDANGGEEPIAPSTYEIVGHEIYFTVSLESLMQDIVSIRVAYTYQE